jgi:formate hydrogenlyase subunit 3/multisubunit Na+/H+ antiporter MnhD subunit
MLERAKVLLYGIAAVALVILLWDTISDAGTKAAAVSTASDRWGFVYVLQNLGYFALIAAVIAIIVACVVIYKRGK